MKKYFVRLFCLVLCLVTFTQVAFAAESLKNYRVTIEGTKGYEVFLAKHPKFKLVHSNANYPNTSVLANAFLTDEFDSDLFTMNNLFFDSKQLMSKGYCLDLSDSVIISEVVGNMHPSLRDQAMYNGKIYAVPDTIMFDLLLINRQVWQDAGLPDEVPDTMDELLTFLETWCDWLEANPGSDFRIINTWDATVYNESSYTEMITGWIINSYLMYTKYSGDDLTFDAAVLKPMLERAALIGKRLYENEPRVGYDGENAGQALFYTSYGPSWPASDADIIFLRINDDQPKIISCCLLMTAISVNTSQPELCIELLEDLASNFDSQRQAFLIQGTEAVIYEYAEVQWNDYQQRLAEIDAKLGSDNLKASARTELELERTNLVEEMNNFEQSGMLYVMSESQMQSYQAYGDALFIDAPGVFAAGTEDYRTLLNLQKQFAAGTITADKLLNELKRMGQMIQMELGY